MKKELVFLGSKPIGYKCLAWLIENSEQLGIDLKGVLTRARREFAGENDLAGLAQRNGIPVFEHPDQIPECDILYSVQYHIILKAQHIARARQCAVNLHMAPLPEYRGSNQFSFAIIDNKEEFGTTIHLMDTRIDHGDIIYQKRFPIPANCWVSQLYELTEDASFKLFQLTIAHIITGNFKPVPQSSLENKYGTTLHFRNEMNALKVIDLNWGKEKIERHIRATYMPGFEPPYFLVDGQRIYCSKAN